MVFQNEKRTRHKKRATNERTEIETHDPGAYGDGGEEPEPGVQMGMDPRGRARWIDWAELDGNEARAKGAGDGRRGQSRRRRTVRRKTREAMEASNNARDGMFRKHLRLT